MNRRSLLTSAGVLISPLLAGCLGTGVGGENTTVRITEIDADATPDLPVSPEVAVVDAEATETAPASISITWHSESEDALRIGEERSIVFYADRSEDRSAYLLKNDGTWDETAAFDECWYVAGGVGGDGEYRTVELEPQASYDGESGLYAASRDCLTSGSYRFETMITASKRNGSEHEEASSDWGVTLQVETGGDSGDG